MQSGLIFAFDEVFEVEGMSGPVPIIVLSINQHCDFKMNGHYLGQRRNYYMYNFIKFNYDPSH